MEYTEVSGSWHHLEIPAIAVITYALTLGPGVVTRPFALFPLSPSQGYQLYQGALCFSFIISCNESRERGGQLLKKNKPKYKPLHL